ncbi:LXG domain-containing protein, partial [Bhargavaea beijingensis]|nr:LXG domain-containing protein [Bhargavaea beijingensis]
MTDETNAIMDQVADIVSLPHLDDSQVQEGVLDARREKNQTVSDLNEFDATQTNRLMPVSDQLQAMEQWIAQLGFSTLEGLPPESLMTAPSAAIGNSTKKPEAKSENGFLNAAKEFADTMLFDDLKTITDKDSSLLQKGVAIFGMTPMGKGVKAGKLGFKLVKETPIGKWFKADTNDVA